MANKYGNLNNFRAMPLIENYWGKHYQKIQGENGRIEYDTVGTDFQYSDGTSDSYVKRGFDEEYIQALSRREGVAHAYRIMTTQNHIEFKPKDKVYIGDRELTIIKVLPLLNTNDNIRMYNYAPNLYRDLAVKLVYLE